MDEQLILLQQALARQALVPAGAPPIDISVSRQYGESTVTMRTQLGAGAVPARGMPSGMPSAPPAAPHVMPLSDVTLPVQNSGVQRAYTRNSFYEAETEVPALLAEIDRLKRKALARGVNLTSPHEGVPAEDVSVLRQVFSIADDTGDGRIDRDQLGQLHQVLGEPLTDAELTLAFKAMDVTRQGSIGFDDFLAWYTLAHSESGVPIGSSASPSMQVLITALHFPPTYAVAAHPSHTEAAVTVGRSWTGGIASSSPPLRDSARAPT